MSSENKNPPSPLPRGKKKHFPFVPSQGLLPLRKRVSSCLQTTESSVPPDPTNTKKKEKERGSRVGVNAETEKDFADGFFVHAAQYPALAFFFVGREAKNERKKRKKKGARVPLHRNKRHARHIPGIRRCVPRCGRAEKASKSCSCSHLSVLNERTACKERRNASQYIVEFTFERELVHRVVTRKVK